MDFASYVPLTPAPSAAPSAYGTPLSRSGTPSPIERDTTPTPIYFSAPKPVRVYYGDHSLSGQLYLVSTEDYLNGLFPRFFDILPSAEPSVNKVKRPFVLSHAVQGLSWVDGEELPTLRDVFGAEGQRIGDHFIAVTDDVVVFEQMPMLGKCELNGTFTPAFEGHTDIILALPCIVSLPNPREGRLSTKKASIKEYPPVPVNPSLYRTITKIRTALADPSVSAGNKTGIGRIYINDNFTEILDPDSRVLSQQHPLWSMRGNVALWKMSVWNMLCYKTNVKKALRDLQPMPAAYHEDVFEDKRERERFVMEQLSEVGFKYYNE